MNFMNFIWKYIDQKSKILLLFNHWLLNIESTILLYIAGTRDDNIKHIAIVQ